MNQSHDDRQRYPKGKARGAQNEASGQANGGDEASAYENCSDDDEETNGAGRSRRANGAQLFWLECCAVSRLLPFSPADDMMNVERGPACVSASRRRRDRRLRSFWCHECMTVRMALATAAHHSSQRVSSAFYSDRACGTSSSEPSTWHLHLLSSMQHQLQ